MMQQKPTAGMQQPLPAAVPSWNGSATQISFDDMAEFFKLPIAEASFQLGVCSSTLKRICRDNGIPRWPYRKIMAGKSIEDIRREAAEDMKAKHAAEQQHMSALAESQYIMTQAIPDRKFGSWTGVSCASQTPLTAGLGQGQAHRDYVPMAMASSVGHKAKVYFPSFLDDFKQGFPSAGLSRAWYRWWGNKESGAGNRREEARCDEEEQDDLDSAEEESDEEETAVSSFARKRKLSARTGRRVLRLAVSRGYGTQRVGERESELLKCIFGAYLPQQWKAVVA